MRRFIAYACIGAALSLLLAGPAAAAEAVGGTAAQPTVQAAGGAVLQPTVQAAGGAVLQPTVQAAGGAVLQPTMQAAGGPVSQQAVQAAAGTSGLTAPAVMDGGATEPVTGAAVEAVADYPSRPLRIVVPYAAGGSTDVLARALADKVAAALGQPVSVENKPGAGSNIAANHVAKSDPDGYTLFLGTSTSLAVNESLFKNLAFNPYRDFAPVVLAAMLPCVFVVPAKSKINTLQELTASLLKDDSADYASAGNGTPSHMGGELYKRITGAKATHVPYKGGITALTELAGEEDDFMIALVPEAMPQVKEGKLRALAVTTAKRLPAWPDLPTAAESGVPDYELLGWYGVVAPKATPQPILDKLNAAFNEALDDPRIRTQLTGLGFEVQGGPADRLSDLMRSEWARWKRFIIEAHVIAD